MRIIAGAWIALAAMAGSATAQLPPQFERARQDTTRSYTIGPRYEGTITGGVTRVNMENKFSARLTMKNGYNSIANLGIAETHYRLQDRFSNNKNAQITFIAPLRAGLIFDAAAIETKTFDRVKTTTNNVQELTNNPRRLRAGLAQNKFYSSGLVTEMKVGGNIARVAQTFQVDHDLEATAHGAVKLRKKAIPQGRFTPLIGGWKVSLEGRGWYTNRYTETDDATRYVREDGLGGEQDSLKSFMRLDMTPTSFIEWRHDRYYGTDERMTFPRGVIGNQQFGAELVRETELREIRVTNLRGQSQPTPHMTLGLSVEHRDDLNDFAFEKQQFKHIINTRVGGNITYTMWRMRFGVTLQVDSTRNDFQTLSSYTDRRRSLRFTTDILDSEKKSTKIQTQYGISLLQTYYFDFAGNPRDRDQQDAYFNVRVLSDPFPKVSTNVYMSITRAEYISISGQFSQNNRSDLTYDIRPEITYQLNPRVQIKQTYGLNTKFTDQFYESPGVEDLLDRNVTFTNVFKVQLTPRLRGEMLYSLLLHDRGSYQPLDEANPDYSQRYFSSGNEDRRDQMDISFEFDVSRHLKILGKNRYSRRVDTFVASGNQNVFTDGGVELGAAGSYKWGTDRDVNFRLIRVKQFGRFTRPEQEDFWRMNTEIVYAF